MRFCPPGPYRERKGASASGAHASLAGLRPLYLAFWRANPNALGLLAAILAVLLLRLPSFFEPPWNTDEGIFAAVAQRLIYGGDLYADAWESKPPLFLYLYAALFKVLGASVFSLRLAATASALATQLTAYAIARRYFDPRRALLSSLVLGVLLGVPFWEGTLALTEIFAILPTSLAVLSILAWDANPRPAARRNGLLLLAGALFGAAFLLRQTSAVVAVAVVIWLMVRDRAWVRAGLWMSAGVVLALAPVVLLFVLRGTFRWFWDANVGFFLEYIPSGAELPFASRPAILLPFFATVGCLLWYRRRGDAPTWGLPALWLTLTLAAAMLTGRPYSHYMLQAFPPLALLIGFCLRGLRLAWPPARAPLPVLVLVLALAIEWGYVVTPMFSGNPLAMHFTRGPTYYANFAGWALGLRSSGDYNNYFDRRVNLTIELEKTLDNLTAEGDSVYIWGEYPWIYPLANVKPADRYVTSFYVLLRPYLDVSFGKTLTEEDPRYIVLLLDARPTIANSSPVVDRRYRNATKGLDEVLTRRYQRIAVVGRAHIYRRAPAPSIGGIVAAPPEGVESLP